MFVECTHVQNRHMAIVEYGATIHIIRGAETEGDWSKEVADFREALKKDFQTRNSYSAALPGWTPKAKAKKKQGPGRKPEPKFPGNAIWADYKARAKHFR